jgi:hypothetical protein
MKDFSKMQGRNKKPKITSQYRVWSPNLELRKPPANGKDIHGDALRGSHPWKELVSLT